MKKKKKSSCSCIPQQDVCDDSLLNTCKHNNTCKPVNSCKKSVKKYIEPICNDCEVKFVDTCADLASKAEELFEKSLTTAPHPYQGPSRPYFQSPGFCAQSQVFLTT